MDKRENYCNDENQERHGGARSHGRGEECGHGPNMIVYRKMEVVTMYLSTFKNVFVKF